LDTRGHEQCAITQRPSTRTILMVVLVWYNFSHRLQIYEKLYNYTAFLRTFLRLGHKKCSKGVCSLCSWWQKLHGVRTICNYTTLLAPCA